MNYRIPAFPLSGFLATCSAAAVAVLALTLAGCQERQVVETTLTDLISAYDANEASAQAAYQGRDIRLSAEVTAINLNSDDQPFVNLGSHGTLLPVQAKFMAGSEGQAAQLRKGGEYWFRCQKVSEVLGTPMLTGCVVEGEATAT